MSVPLNSCLSRVSADFDRIRATLYDASTARISSTSVTRERGALATSMAYIWMCASLEAYMKDFLSTLIKEINASGVTYSELSPCLYSIAFAEDLQSLRDLKNLKMWSKRSNMFVSLHNNSTVTLSEKDIPLDGKSIRPEHLDAIWDVFQFDQPKVPHPKHLLALSDLADGRNSVAHGEVDPITFGRNKAYADTIRIVNLIDEITIHISITGETYLRQGKYKK
jgi:RiboL-PSP-HEPN